MTTETHATALQRREQFTFYCPHGHPQSYVTGETELDKVRRERDRLKQDAARLADQQAASERKIVKLKLAAKRQAKRVAAGVCPCCNRTFKQLAAHMAAKHPNHATQ